MNLGELFTNLSLGELSNLSLGTDGAGSIADVHKPKIIRHINAGLLRIYSRFILLEKILLVEQLEGKTTYPLRKEFAESEYVAGTSPYPYIKDLGEPFTDDVIKILGVYDTLGRKLSINDDDDAVSIFTPQGKVLQVPAPVPTALLSVNYQAKHPTVVNDPDQDINLPDVLEDALTEFVAWKVYSNINTQEAQAISQGHEANYEKICMEAVTFDLVNTSLSSSGNKFYKRGWR